MTLKTTPEKENSQTDPQQVRGSFLNKRNMNYRDFSKRQNTSVYSNSRRISELLQQPHIS